MLTALQEEMNKAILAAENHNIGSLESGWAMTEAHHGGKINSAAVKATGKSLMPSIGVGGALIGVGALTMTPVGLIAAPVIGAAMLAKIGVTHAQVKHVFKSISNHQSVSAELIHYSDIDPYKVLDTTKIKGFKRVKVYQIAFDNASVVRTHIYWATRNSATYDFKIYRNNGIDAQFDSWDASFASAKSLKA